MRITVKGQVTLPREFRLKFGLLPGMEVRFVEKGNHVVLEKTTGTHPIDAVYGILHSNQRTDPLIESLRGKK